MPRYSQQSTMQDDWWKAVKPCFKPLTSYEDFLRIAREKAQEFVRDNTD